MGTADLNLERQEQALAVGPTITAEWGVCLMGGSGQAVDVYANACKKLGGCTPLLLEGGLLLELLMQLRIFIIHVFLEAAPMVCAARWYRLLFDVMAAPWITHSSEL